MLFIIVVIFICRAFYRLAVSVGKDGWRCAASSFVVFYAWAYISDFILFFAIELFQPEAPRLIPTIFLNLISALVALLMTWFYYSNLKQAFHKSSKNVPMQYWTI